LLDITRLKIRVLEQIPELVGGCIIVIPIQVKHELETLAAERGKTGIAARVALEVLQKNHIRIVSATAQNGDQALQELSKKGYIIATNDKALRQSLKNAPQRAIVVRQSKYLAWQ
jgi:rRNA-processing protein FCF1